MKGSKIQINKSMGAQSEIVKFFAALYMEACRRALDENYCPKKHKKEIIKALKNKHTNPNNSQNNKRIPQPPKTPKTPPQIRKTAKNPKNPQNQSYQLYIPEYTQYTTEQFVLDLLQVTADMKAVLEQKDRNRERFRERIDGHFGGSYARVLGQEVQGAAYRKVGSVSKTKNIIQWYKDNQAYMQKYDNTRLLTQSYPSTLYFMGLTKGNGVALHRNFIASCAHVFISQQTDQLMKIRCFATAEGGYGVVYVQEGGLFREQDVCFGDIIDGSGLVQGSQIGLGDIRVEISNYLTESLLKFGEFKPVPCVQVGLLYIPDQQLLQTFQTAQGFIEKNQYKDLNDISLHTQKKKQQMSKLVHNCYGMWGTSGSPLWNMEGELIGIHNSWNCQGYGVSMIVHDEDQQDQEESEGKFLCRVIKQYERRAISVHVLNKLFSVWMQTKSLGQKMQEQNIMKESNSQSIQGAKQLKQYIYDK